MNSVPLLFVEAAFEFSDAQKTAFYRERRFRVSKKWLNATFLSFMGFALQKYEVPPRETGRN